MKNDIREMLEDLGMDEDFIVQFEASEMVKLATWCKALYQAGEAMYDELATLFPGCPTCDSSGCDDCDNNHDISKTLNAWEEARKLKDDDKCGNVAAETTQTE